MRIAAAQFAEGCFGQNDRAGCAQLLHDKTIPLGIVVLEQ
jgi:hypothetical protein